MPNLTLKFTTTLGLAIMVLGAALLSPLSREALSRLASESARTTRAPSDAGGQTASPNPGNRGAGQEERVRAALGQEFDRLYSDEKSIRELLGMSRQTKVADFVGHNSTTNRWLIAESKGSDLGTAYEQLQSTTRGLLAKIPDAQIELRVYLDAKNYKILADGGKIYGRLMNADKFLGFLDDADQWQYEVIQGMKILVQAAP